MGNFNRLLITGAATAAVFAGGTPASAAECTPAAQRAYLEKQIETNGHFKGAVLEAPDVNGVMEVTDPKQPGKPVVNPLVIEYAGHVVSFEGRMERAGTDTLTTIPADRAEVTEWIGHRSIPVPDAEPFVSTDHSLHAVPDRGPNVIVGFADPAGEAFALMP